jgi:hypothetical protein
MRSDDAAGRVAGRAAGGPLPRRSSRTPPGPSAAATPTRGSRSSGDSVLALAVTAHLYPRLEAERSARGGLTKIRAQAVSGVPAGRWPSARGCRSGCARRRRRDAERAAAVVETERVLASVIEAVIGACYLQRRLRADLGGGRRGLRREIEEALEHPVDFKSALQELLARRGGEVSYEVTEQSGTAARADLRGHRAGRWSRAREPAAGAARSTPSRRPRARRRRWRRRGPAGRHERAPEVDHDQGLQVLPRPHAAGVRPGVSVSSAPTVRASPTSPTRCCGRWASSRRSRCAASRCRM